MSIAGAIPFAALAWKLLYGSRLGNLTSREAYDGSNVFERNSKTYSGAYAGSQVALVATLHG